MTVEMQIVCKPSLTRVVLLMVLLTSALLAACTSATKKEEAPSSIEAVRQQVEFEDELAEQFEERVQFANDAGVRTYLQTVAQRLIDANAELQSYFPSVRVIRDREASWTSFGLTGNRLYLSTGAVKAVGFENELTAIIAIELAHISKQHALYNLVPHEEINPPENRDSEGDEQQEEADLIEQKLPPIPTELPEDLKFFGAKGIFDYGDRQNIQAIETAVGFLYLAGVDPRGLVGLLQIYQSKPGRSPYPERLVPRLIERARKAVAKQAPLRNPLVQSPQFVAIKQKLRNL